MGASFISRNTTQSTVEEIIKGELSQYWTYASSIKGYFVEHVSSNILDMGGQTTWVPVPNAPRVIVLVNNVISVPAGTGDKYDKVVYFWEIAAPSAKPDPHRTLEEERRGVLQVLERFSEGTRDFIPAVVASKVVGLPIQVTEGWLDELAKEGLIEAQTEGTGRFARILMKGRNELRSEPKKASTPTAQAEDLAAAYGISESLRAFRKDHPDSKKAAFMMMRFGTTPDHEKIVKAIRTALEPYGIAGLRADDREYAADIFSNIKTYMHGCGFGIAVFERIETEEFNPNVSLEVGYMLSMNKPVFLLKDRTLRSLHTDLGGQIYRPFDTNSPQNSISKDLGKWLSDKGLI